MTATMRLMLADGTVYDAADVPLLVQLDERLDAVERAWVGDVEVPREAFPVRVELGPSQRGFLVEHADREVKGDWPRMFGGVQSLNSREAGLDWYCKISPEYEAHLRRWNGLPPRRPGGQP